MRPISRAKRRGDAASALAGIQATETVKVILGVGETLAGRLLLIDALDMEFRTVKLRRNTQCPLCGDNPTIHELIDYEVFCGLKASVVVG